jgi:flagellar biosynthesis protein FliQ
MNEAFVMTLAQKTVEITLVLAGPVLIISLLVGSLISLIQAATQINETTLTFIPKLIGVVAVILLLGSWMLQQLISFTSSLFTSLPTLVR